MSVWDSRHDALDQGVRAWEHQDSEEWARFEDSFAKLPRTLSPRDTDYDRAGAADRFRHRQLSEPEESFPLPLPELNKALLGGLQRGDLVILAGPGKAGKSIWLDQCLEAAAQSGATCRLYLNEMSPEKREARWVQRHLGIGVGRVLHKTLDGAEVERVALEIDNRFPWDATKIHGQGFSEVAEQIVQHRPDVAAIDILTKFHYDSERDLSNGVSTLHAAAESVGACLIIASHLSRAGVNPDTGLRRKPTVNDIKNASSVADFADVVMLLDREMEVDEDGKATGHYLRRAKLLCPFVRDGESADFDLFFSGDELAFEGVA